jgi:hypothetical protein
MSHELGGGGGGGVCNLKQNDSQENDQDSKLFIFEKSEPPNYLLQSWFVNYTG